MCKSISKETKAGPAGQRIKKAQGSGLIFYFLFRYLCSIFFIFTIYFEVDCFNQEIAYVLNFFCYYVCNKYNKRPFINDVTLLGECGGLKLVWHKWYYYNLPILITLYFNCFCVTKWSEGVLKIVIFVWRHLLLL